MIMTKTAWLILTIMAMAYWLLNGFAILTQYTDTMYLWLLFSVGFPIILAISALALKVVLFLADETDARIDL